METSEYIAAALGQSSAEAMLGMLADMQERIWELEAEVDFWRNQTPAARPAKGRSPKVWRFRVTRWEWVEMVIKPRSDPAGKTIKALRVYCPLEDQGDGPGYWDLTGQQAQAMIEPLLPSLVGEQRWIELRQMGRGALSRYTVAVAPA